MNKYILRKLLLEKLVSDIKIAILGSGPSGGILNKKGKNHRLETSVIISINDKNILINATHFLKEQLEEYKIRKITAVLLSHGHSDIISGLPSLPEKIPAYALKETFDTVHRKFKTEYIVENKIKPYKQFNIDGIKIIPVFVIHDEVNPDRFPCTCWQIKDKNKSIIFCDDFTITKLPLKSEKYFMNNDIAFLDCAVKRPMIGHSSFQELLPYIKKWKNKKTYLIQIGKEWTYQELTNEIKKNKLYPEMSVSYDGLKIYL